MIIGIAVCNNFANIVKIAISYTPTVFVVIHDRHGSVLYNPLKTVN